MIWGRGRWHGRPSESGAFRRWISCAALLARAGRCHPKSRGQLTSRTVFSDPTSCPSRVCAVLSSPYRGHWDTNVQRTLSCLDPSDGAGLLNRVAQENKKYSSLPSIGPPLPHLHLQSPRTPDGDIWWKLGGNPHGGWAVFRNLTGQQKTGFG